MASERPPLNNDMTRRLSNAMDILKEIPASILHSFILDLYKLKPKEEIQHIIKSLNSIVFNEGEGYAVETNNNCKKRKNISTTPITSKQDSSRGKREAYNLYKELSYWANVSHSFGPKKTAQRLRPRAKTIDENPGSRLRKRAKTLDGVPRTYHYDSDTKQNEPIVEGSDYHHFKIYKGDGSIKEYVCFINECKHNLKAMPLITLIRHVENNHNEVWDGHCSFCKNVIALQGKHTFKDCLQHMFDNHLDNFTVLKNLNHVGTTSQDIPNLGMTGQSDKGLENHTEVSTTYENSIVIYKVESLDDCNEHLEEQVEPLIPDPVEEAKPEIKETYNQKERQHEDAVAALFSFIETAINPDKAKRKLSETGSESARKRIRFETEPVSGKANLKEASKKPYTEKQVMNTDEGSTEPNTQPSTRGVQDSDMSLLKEQRAYVCDLTELKKVNLKNNNQTSKKTKNVFKCDICPNSDYTYQTQMSLLNHRLRHYDLRPLTCTSCNKMFCNNDSTLQKHEKKEHLGNKCIFVRTEIPEGAPVVRKDIPIPKPRTWKAKPYYKFP